MAGIRHKMASGETIRSPDPSQPSRSGRHRFPVKLLATTLEAGGNPLGMEDLALVTTLVADQHPQPHIVAALIAPLVA